MLTTNSQEKLRTKNQALRGKLKEAEETARAIQHGEVDAFLVADARGGDRLYTLKGADKIYRTLIEEMSDGALTLSAEHVVLYANRLFAEMLKCPLQQVIGAAISTWIAADQRPVFLSLVHAESPSPTRKRASRSTGTVSDSEGKRHGEVVLTASDGTSFPVYLSVNQILGSELPNVFCVIVTDLTEQKSQAAAVASEKLAHELLASSNQSRQVLEDLLEKQKQAQKKIELQVIQLQDNLKDTVHAIANIVEMRDPYTAGHQVRVAALASAIATEMALPADQVEAIQIAGIVHDLGKISVPAEILSKPGKINEAERNLIKLHPQAGYDILKDIHFPWPIALMVLQHHERLDGSGYPQGLKGEEILLGARILSVADVVEAMSSHRPYRPGLGTEAALAEIAQFRGTHYDAQAVDACLTIFCEKGYRLNSEPL
jgi:PAS domain S-box-containing protein